MANALSRCVPLRHGQKQWHQRDRIDDHEQRTEREENELCKVHRFAGLASGVTGFGV